ncbi:cyclic pyranopterin monophosphate synthase MoaC [Natranaerofaba carboxydovora]|uniref:cyclic pyranopterin monophosphate synthase MoaC n=1 Tax=Natranaerofaba carboxydovora TaxID=2742683 RepID=UPI001F12CDAC|nr:cyclic pyranopterin monophosphate synthase MoaC [Natranaerofaba carboxydovora]UMZ72851.1 Cyclic pyranopterin monophosphate synthase [Natranaerofaba carboxydovora]
MNQENSFTHMNESGRPRMVDVGTKEDTKRKATACGYIYMAEHTLKKIIEGQIKKGDVLNVAQTAGIMGAKKTSEIIPMCHLLMLTGVDIDFEIDEKNNRICIEAAVTTTGKTGVEMEALTAVSTCALTVYDMCKSIDKEMEISDIKLIKKTGGKSGTFIKEK